MPQSRMSQFMQQFGRPQSGNPWGQFQRPPQRPGPFPGYGDPAPQPPMKPVPQSPQMPQPGMPTGGFIPPQRPQVPQMPQPGGSPMMGHMGPGSMPMPPQQGGPYGGFIPQRPMGEVQQRNPMMAQQAQANMLRRY